LARSLFETARLWFGSGQWLDDYVDVRGLNHLTHCSNQHQAVLLVSCHFTSIEVAGAALCRLAPFHPVYAAAKNPVFDRFQRAKRLRFAPGVVLRSDMRQAARLLRQRQVLWLLPDQAVAEGHGAVHTRFFAQPVMSSTGPGRLQKLGQAQVVLFDVTRRRDGGLCVSVHPPLSAEDDPGVFAQSLNDHFEGMIRQSPAEYFWHHKRFKSPQPEDDPYRL